MTVLVLSEHEVERLLDMESCVEAMAEVLAALARDELFLPLRSVARPEGAPSLMGLMPAYRDTPAPLWSLKEIVISPDNPARGLDTHQGGVLLHDGTTGRARRAPERVPDHRDPNGGRLGCGDPSARP